MQSLSKPATAGKPRINPPHKARVNLVARTINAWVFRAMSEALLEWCRDVEIVITRQPIGGCQLYHFFRPQDATAAVIRGFSKPFVTTLHGELPGVTDYRTCRPGYDLAEKVICVSETARKILANAAGLNGKLALIHAGADANKFRFERWPQGHFTVGVVSRNYPLMRDIADVKGGEMIIETMTRLAEKLSDILLMVVGVDWEGLIDEMLRRSIPVVYYDRRRNCTYDDYPRLYNQMDCLLVASKFEGGPVAAYEAMMCGRPVVGPAVGVLPELIEQKRTGMLCERNAESLAEGLEWMCRLRPDFAEGRWKDCAERVKGFTWERWAEEHERLYLEVLKSKSANLQPQSLEAKS